MRILGPVQRLQAVAYRRPQIDHVFGGGFHVVQSAIKRGGQLRTTGRGAIESRQGSSDLVQRGEHILLPTGQHREAVTVGRLIVETQRHAVHGEAFAGGIDTAAQRIAALVGHCPVAGFEADAPGQTGRAGGGIHRQLAKRSRTGVARGGGHRHRRRNGHEHVAPGVTIGQRLIRPDADRPRLCVAQVAGA